MPEDNSAKKDAAKQDKSTPPYKGPSAAELEPKIASFLPGLRIYFAPDPRYTKEQMEAMIFQESQRQGRIEEKLVKGEAVSEAESKSNLPPSSEIDYILDSERMTQTLRQKMQEEVLTRLHNYSRATIAEGTFAEKWPEMLANISRYDTLVAFNAANAVLQDKFPDAAMLKEKPELLTVAKRAFLDMGLRDTRAHLSISEAEYKKRRLLDPGYNIQTYEDQFVTLLENHFYLARSAGTFATEWPAKMDQAVTFAPDLAVRGAARFFERVAVEIVDGRRQPLNLNASDFVVACKTAEKACASAAEAGDALLASDIMGKVLYRLVQAGRAGAIEQKDFFALATEMQAAQEKFMLQSIDQLTATISKERAEGGNPILAGRARNDLTRVLSQYFYVAEGKGALATEWSAAMDKVAAVDAGVAAGAAGLYFSNPAKPVSLPDFMIASAKTKELSEKAAAQGENALAAETLAHVLNHLRLNAGSESLPAEKRDELTALGMSVGAAEEAIISKGITEALRDVTMSDDELARREKVDLSFSDRRSEERLLFLLDEYLYENIIKGTVSKNWPAKLQEVTAADPDIAAQAAKTFFVAPRVMITDMDEFKSVCVTAAQTAMSAHEKGFSVSAAETLAAMVRSTKRNVEALENDQEIQKSMPEILPALREMDSDFGAKLEAVMHSWEEAIAKKPDDPRNDEQIEYAKSVYLAFVKTLAPAVPVPPPTTTSQPTAPQMP